METHAIILFYFKTFKNKFTGSLGRVSSFRTTIIIFYHMSEFIDTYTYPLSNAFCISPHKSMFLPLFLFFSDLYEISLFHELSSQKNK